MLRRYDFTMTSAARTAAPRLITGTSPVFNCSSADALIDFTLSSKDAEISVEDANGVPYIVSRHGGELVFKAA